MHNLQMHRMSLTSLAWLMRILAVTKVRIHVSDSRRYTIAGVSVLNRLRNPISTRLDLLYATRVSLHPRRNISMPMRWLDESINTCTHVSLVEKARTRAMGTVVKKKEREKRYNSQPVERPRDREIYEPILSIGARTPGIFLNALHCASE